MNAQQKMKSLLKSLGVPFKEIEVYGSQIVITCGCLETANRWASVLCKFSTVRGVIESLDEAKANHGTVLRPSYVRVWRTFARIS